MASTSSDSGNSSGMQVVEAYLSTHYAHDPDKLVKFLFYLHGESSIQFGGNTPVRDYLNKLISTKNEPLIKAYLHNVWKDVEKADMDPMFKTLMYDLYAGFNSAKELDPLSENWLKAVNKTVKESTKNPESYYKLYVYVTSAVTSMDKASWPQLLASLESNAATNASQLAHATETSMWAVEKMSTYGKYGAMIALTAVQLSWEAIKNIWAWWNGEISGKRCSKNVVDALASVTAGAAGSYGGAWLGGAVFGPVGSLMGGVIGGVGASSLAAKLVDTLSSKFFDLPKTTALENAYGVLGVHHSADNMAINSAYRQKSLTCHPDKAGGSPEKWLTLQVALQTIKCSRESTF